MRKLFLAAFFLTCCAATQVRCQSCDHLANTFERFDAVRLMPAVKVKAFNGKQVEWLWEGATGIRAGTVEVDPETRIDPTFSKDYKKGLWWIMWSTCDGHVYFVNRVTPDQLKSRPTAARATPQPSPKS